MPQGNSDAIRRRQFVGLLGGAVAWPLAAGGQQPLPVIGVLGSGSRETFEFALAAFRQGLRELTLIRMTPDLIYDQMIGMGLAKKLIFSWGGNPGVGSLHRFRDAVERGWPRALEIEEHSHAAIANAYAAGASGMPCAFFRGYRGTDLPRVNPKIKFISCPFTG